ncbi:MAG: sulfatase-like hydrolase/transferase [Selenomonadaceae bacterium]|nr:sulfatase-like hydrolase/transferase [Selenomonadaceae bacterium]
MHIFDCQRIRFLIILLVTYLIIQSGTRLIMLLSSIELISTAPFELIKTFGLAVVYDLTAGFCFCMPIALLLIFNWRRIITASVFIFDLTTIFISVSLFLFWREFHTNFNFIAVDYLIYTHEMLGNIWQSFNLLLILPAILIVTIILFKLQQKILPLKFNKSTILNLIIYTLPVILIPVIMVYIVQSNWRDNVSDNRHNVELAGNGAYEFVRAFFTNELDYDTFYITQDNSVVINNLRGLITADNAAFVEDNVARIIKNDNELTNRRLNVVMITVESLNAGYSAAFGAEESLTPHLDELAAKSYIFTRMYATGTRTVRGLEALSLSLPPTPGQSILRRADNGNLASLGEAFRQNGYVCDFIYGGYGYFDNMNAFFEGNGYNIKDRTTIPEDEIFHETIWGVADEILFTQVLKSMDEHFSKGERAFEMIITTSNHRPFTFPEGRIDMPDGTRPAAVRYTDWAIHDFLERASNKPWFNDTIFVIVADHQALAAGKTTLPVNCYHIPCLIYAPKIIEANINDRLISQMDLPPTLLGILGLSYNSKFLGHDINCVSSSEERVFIGTYQLLGFIKNDKLIILTPDKRVTAYQIDNWSTSEYTNIELPDNLVNEAIAYYQGTSYLFKNKLLTVGN